MQSPFLRTAAAIATAVALPLAAAIGAASSVASAQTLPAQTQVLFVSPSGSASGTGSMKSPFLTIQAAVTAASSGDTVVVEPGTYNEEVTIAGKALTLESAAAFAANKNGKVAMKGDSASKMGMMGHAAAQTVIDATGDANALVITGSKAAGTVVRGLTLENAQKAGLVAISTSNLTIEGNVLTANDQSCASYNGCNTPTQQTSFSFTNTTPCSATNDCETLHLVGVQDSTVSWNDVVNNLDGGIYLTDETGPSADNVIAHNTVENNAVDCGITLGGHSGMATANPSAAGIYGNVIEDNVANGNGAAGILLGAAAPGAGVYDNMIIHNQAENNGLPGIAIHSHAPNQNISGNVVVGNYVSGNGADPGFVNTSTGIAVASAVVPVTSIVIADNTVVNEQSGVFLTPTVTDPVLAANTFENDQVTVLNPPASPSASGN